MSAVTEEAVIAHAKKMISMLGDMGVGLAKESGWQPKIGPDAPSVEEQGVDLVRMAVPLVIAQLKAEGLLT